MIRSALTLAVLAILSATPALPCSFHGYVPQATFVERLLGSDHIVLARPTKQKPFSYAEIEVLEGDTEFVEIAQLVDSVTRRRLAANPEDHVLFARDGAYGPWQRVAYIDADMGKVLNVVMDNLPVWEMGDEIERFSYFATLLNHPNREVHALALRELDIADYDILRSLDLNVHPQRLMSRLNLRFEEDLKPIRVLLLGLSNEPVAQGFFESGVQANANRSGGLLGAYATAMIEHGGPEAVERLVDRHLKNRSLPAISREMLTEALAIHSSAGDAETRDAIRVAVGLAVSEDSELATMVARHFGARYDWSQEETISTLMRSGAVKSPIDMLLLTQYVSLARENTVPVQN
ncbi:hypothetical protein [Primorskyibacter sp. S87]|uniref:hypothetical protein n=1 Tax=Primorskyibacter sp. S87 TaxID=3415126 RepID=UPI003C7C0508